MLAALGPERANFHLEGSERHIAGLGRVGKVQEAVRWGRREEAKAKLEMP